MKMNLQKMARSFILSTFIYNICAAFNVPEGAPDHHHDIEHEGQVFRLYCRSGYFLQIMPDGSVNGTRSGQNKYTLIHKANNGIGVVDLEGIESGRYLTMLPHGRIVGMPTKSNESKFYESPNESGFLTFQSYSLPPNSVSSGHHDGSRTNSAKWYLAVGKTGNVRKNANVNKQMTHFLQVSNKELDNR